MKLKPAAASLLLVDDQSTNLLALEATLGPLGHRLVKAQSGAEALRLILQEDFAAILLDVRLEDMNGMEVTALIRQRERSRHIPILLLTALEGDEQEVLQGYAEGAVDFLRKPFPPEILQAKVSVFVELHQAREEVKRQAALLREKERQLLERTHREQLHSLLMQAPAAMAITHGPEFVFEFVNPLYEKVAGRPVPLGKPLREVLPEVLSQPGVMEVLHRVMRTGEPFIGLEFPVALDRHGNGTPEEAYFNLVYSPIRDVEGHITGLLTHAVEVTEHVLAHRKVEALAEERQHLLQQASESEDRLRLALSAADVGTWDFNPVTGVLRWDERTKALFGLPPTAAVDYDTFLAGLHPEDRERTDAMVQRSFNPESGGEYRIEYRTVGFEDGVERWVAAHGRSYFDGQGRAVRFIGTVRDITASKRAEAQARQQAEFEQQLVGIVGHDLRNPLSAILVSAELLKTRVTDERLLRPVARITSSALRASSIVGDLLDLTRVRMGGGLPVQPQPMDLHEVVRQVVEEYRAAHPERDIRLTSSPEVRGEWDAARLAQVISNLLGNALQYSPAGSPIRVGLEAAEQEALLHVHNGGPCIPAALQPHLFEPFKRGHGDTASKSLGLGLFIVERIVSAHGGRIECRSTEEEGTTFLIRLPRSVAHHPPEV